MGLKRVLAGSTLLAVAVAVVTAWLWSGWARLGVSQRYSYDVFVEEGEFAYCRWEEKPSEPVMWTARRNFASSPRWRWFVADEPGLVRPQVERSWWFVHYRVCGPGVVPGWQIKTPLWPFVLGWLPLEA
ncbi:MAG TPA: hypothetical protein VFF65_05835 [Phycisphaerales bacterium]|nr:hypothetical protein [Phycisphaerales bacterium]